MKTKLKNNKGGFYGVIIGLSIMVMAIIFYIIYDVIVRGGSTGQGMFYMAENSFNITETNSDAYSILKNTWYWAPVMLMVLGIIYAFVSTQREEYFRQPI
jgi:hypothetical protein